MEHSKETGHKVRIHLPPLQKQKKEEEAWEKEE